MNRARSNLLGCLWAGLVVLCACHQAGAQPTNDDFANATVIAATPFTGTLASTAGATVEPGEPTPSCQVNTGATVWYRFTPAADASVLVDTAGSSYDTVVAVYTGGSLATLTAVACNDDFSTYYSSRVIFAATAGTTYYIQVGSVVYDGVPDTGQLFLNLDTVTPPPNDNFADATAVAATPFTTTVTTTFATTQQGEPAPACQPNTGATVWYRFTSPVDSTVAADTLGSTYDTVLAVYSGGTLATLTPVACNDDISDSVHQSRLTFVATGGVPYYFQIGGFTGFTPFGSLTFDLNASGVTPTAIPSGTATPPATPTTTPALTPTKTPLRTPTSTVPPIPTATRTAISTPTASTTPVPQATATRSPSPTTTATAAPPPSLTPVATGTPTMTVTPTRTGGSEPTATPTTVPCHGDCNGDREVTVNEVITLVNITLGNADASACEDGIPADAEVNIALIVQAVNNALGGCGG